MLTAAAIAFFLVQGGSERALALYQQHKYAEAAAAFEELAGERPGHPEFTAYLGESLYLSGQYAKAAQWLEKAATGTARQTECRFMLASAYLMLQEPEKSVALFADVFGLPRDSAAAHLAAAQMMLHRELLDYAEAQLHRALAINPQIAQAQYELGVIALSRGDAEAAVEAFEREIAINPAFGMTYYRLGDAYNRQEKRAEAIVSLQRSIWLNPNYSGSYVLLGKIYFQQRDFVNAEGVLRRAIEMDTQNRAAHYLLGQTLMRTGHEEEGRRLLKRSEELGENRGQ